MNYVKNSIKFIANIFSIIDNVCAQAIYTVVWKFGHESRCYFEMILSRHSFSSSNVVKFWGLALQSFVKKNFEFKSRSVASLQNSWYAVLTKAWKFAIWSIKWMWQEVKKYPKIHIFSPKVDELGDCIPRSRTFSLKKFYSGLFQWCQDYQNRSTYSKVMQFWIKKCMNLTLIFEHTV